MARSSYYSALTGLVKLRYDSKLTEIRNLDPYVLKTGFHNEWHNFPNLTSDSVCFYLFNSVSAYSGEELNAKKSFGGSNFVASDKVGNLRVRKIGERFLLCGQVQHSWSNTKKPCEVWAICSADAVISSHCTCTAGLREGCSHVGAVLFAVVLGKHQAKPKSTAGVSVTDVPAYWSVPGNLEKVEQKKLKDIDFSTPQRLNRRKLGLDCSPSPKRKPDRPTASSEEWEEYIRNVFNTGTVSAVHQVKEEYVVAIKERMPKSILDLYKADYEKLSLPELQRLGETVEFHLSDDERKWVFKESVGQAVKKAWFIFRAGRIRGSLLRRFLHTNIDDPSISLLKAICYPHETKFRSAATDWGCEHEATAAKAYKLQMKEKHKNFKLSAVGFSIPKHNQEFGSSADGQVSCDCHGKGCLEIKCPYCLRDKTALEIQETNYCLQTFRDEEGNVRGHLKRDHAFYYQVQCEMYALDVPYCDFVLWTTATTYIERIQRDEAFWSGVMQEGKQRFKKIILPEVLGRYFSRLARQKEQKKNQNIHSTGAPATGVRRKPKGQKKQDTTTTSSQPTTACQVTNFVRSPVITSPGVLHTPALQRPPAILPIHPPSILPHRRVLGQLQPKVQPTSQAIKFVKIPNVPSTPLLPAVQRPPAPASTGSSVVPMQIPTNSVPSTTPVRHITKKPVPTSSFFHRLHMN